MIRKVLEQDSKVQDIAKQLYEKRSLLIMGRGYNYATCLEGALKVCSFYEVLILNGFSIEKSFLICQFLNPRINIFVK